MIKVGVVQTKNSTDHQTNFESILNFLAKFEKVEVDLILFPECALSGFAASIQNCKLEILEKYFLQVAEWTRTFKKDVILSSAIIEDKIFNSGFIFSNGDRTRFYKNGLTESEKRFFASPEIQSQKIFKCKDYKYALLICIEAEHEPTTYFNSGDADFILWPGYWGWKKIDNWSEVKNFKEHNKVFENMFSWKIPLIQSNFSNNASSIPQNNCPQGLSVVVDFDNSLKFRGEFEKETAYIVCLEKDDKQTYVRDIQKVLD